jgi:hypothetical protein
VIYVRQGGIVEEDFSDAVAGERAWWIPLNFDEGFEILNCP